MGKILFLGRLRSLEDALGVGSGGATCISGMHEGIGDSFCWWRCPGQGCPHDTGPFLFFTEDALLDDGQPTTAGG